METAAAMRRITAAPFDFPTMTYLPNGKIDDGPLSTDRPNTATGVRLLRVKWKMETNLGVTQSAYQGTPIILPAGSRHFFGLPVGRGPRQFREAGPATRMAASLSNGVVNNARTDPLIQTDFNLRHEIVMKESIRLAFEATFINLFNQRAVESVYQFMIPPTWSARPGRPASRATRRWIGARSMNGYNYIDALNGTGAFAGVQSK